MRLLLPSREGGRQRHWPSTRRPDGSRLNRTSSSARVLSWFGRFDPHHRNGDNSVACQAGDLANAFVALRSSGIPAARDRLVANSIVRFATSLLRKATVMKAVAGGL
jgi:hypothetical protein